MSRLGPLSVNDETLVIGHHLGYHARLTETGISHGQATGERAIFAWEDITSATLQLPTTSFRYPGLLATVGFSALIALFMSDPGMDPDDGTLSVRTTDGKTCELTLSRHHVGGYWNRALTLTQNLLDQLISDPETRTLLSHPEALLAATIKAARRRP